MPAADNDAAAVPAADNDAALRPIAQALSGATAAVVRCHPPLHPPIRTASPTQTPPLHAASPLHTPPFAPPSSPIPDLGDCGWVAEKTIPPPHQEGGVVPSTSLFAPAQSFYASIRVLTRPRTISAVDLAVEPRASNPPPSRTPDNLSPGDDWATSSTAAAPVGRSVGARLGAGGGGVALCMLAVHPRRMMWPPLHELWSGHWICDDEASSEQGYIDP